MIWLFLAFGSLGALTVAFSLIYLWTMPASRQDLQRLEEHDLFARWVWDRFSTELHEVFSRRRAYCRDYGNNMLRQMESDMRQLAKLWNRPVMAALAVLAFRILASLIRVKLRLAAGPTDLRGAVALQILLVRWAGPFGESQNAR